MFAEYFSAQEVQNLFLNDNQTIFAMCVVPIKGTGRNCMVVEYGYDECGETARAHFYISDFDVRRPQKMETYENSVADRIATADLRDYLLETKGEKYKSILDEFENPPVSVLIK